MKKEFGRVGGESVDLETQVQSGLLDELPLDSLVKTAVLTTVAGYLKKNQISVNGKEIKRKEFLQDFLSFLLNDRSFAPIDYNICLSFYGKEEGGGDSFHEFDAVILFSGGIDSSSALLHSMDQGRNPLLLWVGFGQKNQGREEKVVKASAELLDAPLFLAYIDLKRYLERGWKDWDYIVPGRNFLFAVLGAALLSRSRHPQNKIVIGVHEEEINHPAPGTDKSPRFFKDSSSLFTDFYGKEIEITTPFESISKTELIAHWNNHWIEKYGVDIHETTSCYYGNNCGECNACFKRSVYLLAAGAGLDPDLKKNPFRADPDHAANYIRRCFGDVGEKKKFTKKRALETLVGYQRAGDDLAQGAKDILLDLPSEMKKEVERRKEALEGFDMYEEL